MAKLVVRAGAEPGREFGLPDGGELKIGRMPGVGITLLDAKVSREHCRLFIQATGWIVEDLTSRNGTYVNSQRVKKRLLQPGDRLRVGQTEFEFSKAVQSAPGVAAPAADAAVPAAPPATPQGRAAQGQPDNSQGAPPLPALRPTKKPPR